MREKWQTVIRARQAYLDSIAETDLLSRELGYTRFNGEAYSLPLDRFIVVSVLCDE